MRLGLLLGNWEWNLTGGVRPHIVLFFFLSLWESFSYGYGKSVLEGLFLKQQLGRDFLFSLIRGRWMLW